ncbi:MAG: pyridoxal-phosphate dependent enzyme [Candidatus Dormibacteraeota bacterium]|nr:pyridoxal-phosphate dependent enzyme [Candidatus Dormibacteraeota bacterium]
MPVQHALRVVDVAVADEVQAGVDRLTHAPDATGHGLTRVSPVTELRAPDFADVLAARLRIAPYLAPTPAYRYAGLDRLCGATVWVKHENHQPVGAFKIRGGINLVSQLSDDERRRGVVTASTGNHGQSIAYAARLFGVSATVCAPLAANPVKVQAIRDLGADVVLEGEDFEAARGAAERIAVERGSRYIHSGDEPLLIAGVATYTLELFEAHPEIDVVIVPIGGGSGAAGACIVQQTVKPDASVIGVQSAQAPAAYRSWKERTTVTAPIASLAEGLQTGAPFALPQRILREMLADFITVSDDDLLHATAAMILHTRNLVEPAGAAALAGAIALRERLEGRTVGIVCSGGNIGPAQLAQVVDMVQREHAVPAAV